MVRLIVPTIDPSEEPQLVGNYYVRQGRSYVRASNVIDVLAPEDSLLNKIEKEGWDWWHERGKAADLGTAVHAECEKLNRYEMYRDAILSAWDGNPLTWPKHQLINGQTGREGVGIYGPKVPEPLVFRTKCPTTGVPLLPFVDSYARWLAEDVEQVVMAEQRVWSDKYAFAGTFDSLVLLKPHRGSLLALVDIKTSKHLNWAYRLQTAAYVQALKETFGIVPDVRLIVHLPSQHGGRKLRIREYGGGDTQQRHDFTTFWGLLRGYRFRDHYKMDWRS